jgi:hypothetical protein
MLKKVDRGHHVLRVYGKSLVAPCMKEPAGDPRPRGHAPTTATARRRQDAVPVVQTSSDEGTGRLSPDGRWIAYTSNKSGRDEICVRPFVPPSAGAPREGGEEWTISKGGSNTMFGWRADGREL